MNHAAAAKAFVISVVVLVIGYFLCGFVLWGILGLSGHGYSLAVIIVAMPVVGFVVWRLLYERFTN